LCGVCSRPPIANVHAEASLGTIRLGG
jgi:hypothetical protein